MGESVLARRVLGAAAFLAALAIGACATIPEAPRAPNALRGAALAADLCQGCHAVADSRPRANPDAPPFSSLLAAYDEERLTRDLQTGALMGHPPLPTVRLSAQGAQDLVAYLKSIKP